MITDQEKTLAAEFQKHLDAYAAHLVNDYWAWIGPKYAAPYDATKYQIEFEPGSKYIRVVHVGYAGTSRSSHSFIVLKADEKFAVGDILKANSWKAPARNFKRGNIFDKNSYRKTTRWTGC